MPGIIKPPVLKSFILHAKAGQAESEQAKQKGKKHKQMKMEALGKKKKHLNPSPYFKYLLNAEADHLCRWTVSSSCSSKLIHKGRLLSAALQLSGFCHSWAFLLQHFGSWASPSYSQGAPDGQPPLQSCTQNCVQTQIFPAGQLATKRRVLLWKLSTNRNFGGANPSAFQRWYQHLTNAHQPLPWGASQQADRVEGRVAFWACKNS